MSTYGYRVMAFLALAASLVLGACEEEEQDRVLLYKKGDYLGAEDTPLSEETQRALRQRAAQQRGQ